MPAFEAKPTVPYVQTAPEQQSEHQLSLDDGQAQLALGDARLELAPGENTAYTFDDGRQQGPTANRQEPGATPPATGLKSLATEGAARGITADFDPTKTAQKMYDCFGFWGNDIPTLCSLVKDLTPEQRASTLQEYAKISGTTIEDSLRRKIPNGYQAERSQAYAALYPGDPITPATITCLGQMDSWFEHITPMIASLNGLSTADYDKIRAGFNQGSGDDGKFDLRLVDELTSADCKRMMDLLLREDPMGRRAYDIYRAFEARQVTADTPVESPLSLEEAQAVREKMASRFDINVDQKLAEYTTMIGIEEQKIAAALYANDPIGRAAFDVANAHFKGEAYYGPAPVHGGKDLVDVITGINAQDLPAVRETVRTRFGKSLDHEILTNNMTTPEQQRRMVDAVYAADPVGRASFEIAKLAIDVKSPTADRKLIEQGFAQLLVNYPGDMRQLAERLKTDHGLELKKTVETTFTDEQIRAEALELIKRESPQAPGAKEARKDLAKLSLDQTLDQIHAGFEKLKEIPDVNRNAVERDEIMAEISKWMKGLSEGGANLREIQDRYEERHGTPLKQDFLKIRGEFGKKWSMVLEGRPGGMTTYELDKAILRDDYGEISKILQDMTPEQRTQAIADYDAANPHGLHEMPTGKPLRNAFIEEITESSLSARQKSEIFKLIGR